MAARIGLTGGIGSGKSTVLAMLQALGAAAIDADAISRATTASGGAAIVAIRARFGPEFVTADGALDRARMRQRAYAHPEARRELEQIIHPLVGEEVARQVDAALAAGARCIVFDIPLLVESGRWRQQVDRVLVVDCSPETQVARVVARSGLAPDEVRAIIAAQAPRALRLAAADLVICNEGLTLEALRYEVEQAARSFGL
ncbi:dephospho-CoA kinase [Ramlibacter ginsenosidimutans]|uniref:Dephospho-CoA kinase n=1 Tax=Ramlibacter ginsenosidimutans TaxID=502333 RepID=A0A934WMT4_9BURK|nr:dephospho-CoA kinase [Ramlibacter ginsenosidimutans]MBK6006981.1 dephospho-CoA kinase [Ramlibacter ginsenosidimutans]